MAGEGRASTKPEYVHVVNLGSPTADAAVGLYQSDLATLIDPATSQKQDAGNTSLSSIDGKVATAAKQDAAKAVLDTQQTSLDAIKAAVEIMDNWAENNRAKVSPIVGRSGVSAGAGATDTGTQRVTLSSDDPLVAKAATKAVQDTQQTSLDAIKDRIGATTAPATGTSNKHLADLVAKDFATTAKQDTIASAVDNVRTDAAARIGDDGTEAPPNDGSGVRGWLRAVYDALVARLGTLGQKAMSASTPVVIASDQSEVRVRDRDETAGKLHFHAGGVTSVSAGAWGTLATVTVPAGKTLRLIMGEADFAEIGAIGNTRGIRVRQAGTVKAAALTGSDQPNPDIEGLTLTNGSAGNETWDLQGRHNAVTSQDMVGWMVWVEVSD